MSVSDRRQSSSIRRKPKRSRSPVRRTRLSGESDCSQAMKASPTWAGQAVGAPFISAASSLSKSVRHSGCGAKAPVKSPPFHSSKWPRRTPKFSTFSRSMKSGVGEQTIIHVIG